MPETKRIALRSLANKKGDVDIMNVLFSAGANQTTEDADGDT